MQDYPVVLHRAPWVLPMDGPVIEDGAVAVCGETIAGAGSFATLAEEYPGVEVVDHPDSALMPGLINAHIHLELSHLAHLGKLQPAKSFTGWITEMLSEREALGFVGTNVEVAAAEVLRGQYEDGVIGLADIGNTGIAGKLRPEFPGLLFPFLEYLGLSRASLVPALKKLEKTKDQVACTAHAPYSTHPELIKALKRRADELGMIFPLHVAEPDSEQSMLSEGRGELVDFLRVRGFYDDDFKTTGMDSGGSVQYLHGLGVLNSATLCVHAIHVSDGEMGLLKKSGAHVCLCPGSNRFLQVGKAPLARYLDHGILPAIGTDSAASNPEVSIWREMQLLAEDHPDVTPADILRMATAGGADALGIEGDYGTLEPGKSSRILQVPVPDNVRSADEICAVLVHGGSSCQPQWMETS